MSEKSLAFPIVAAWNRMLEIENSTYIWPWATLWEIHSSKRLDCHSVEYSCSRRTVHSRRSCSGPLCQIGPGHLDLEVWIDRKTERRETKRQCDGETVTHRYSARWCRWNCHDPSALNKVHLGVLEARGRDCQEVQRHHRAESDSEKETESVRVRLQSCRQETVMRWSGRQIS